MKIQFDENQLLSIYDEKLPQLRNYQYILDWYQIETTDRLIFTYQKRAWKLINLKNLGDGMQVAFSPKAPISTDSLTFDKDQFLNILSLFQGFNEETWIKYHFLPFWNWDIVVLKGQLSGNQYWKNKMMNHHLLIKKNLFISRKSWKLSEFSLCFSTNLWKIRRERLKSQKHQNSPSTHLNSSSTRRKADQYLQKSTKKLTFHQAKYGSSCRKKDFSASN